MMRRLAWAVVVGAMAVAGPAAAQDKASGDMLDLSTPESVAAALQAIGYKGKVSRNDDGTGFVESSAGGAGFTIDFYDCKEGHCASLQFQSFYKPEPLFTPALANEWNGSKRFLKVSVNAKGELREWLDVSTKGRLTQSNFADVVDWYEQMDAGLATFLKERREAKKPG